MSTTGTVRITTRVEKPKPDHVKCILCRMRLPRHEAHRAVVSEYRPPEAAEQMTFTYQSQTGDEPHWHVAGFVSYDQTGNWNSPTRPSAFVTEHSAYACCEDHGEQAIAIRVAELRHNGDARGESEE